MHVPGTAFIGGLGLLAAAAVASAAEGPATHLLAVELDAAGEGITLRGNGAMPDPRIELLEHPPRLVIDLPGLASLVSPRRIEVRSPRIARVRVGQHAHFTRVVLDAGDAPAAFASRRVLPRAEGLSIVLAGGPRLPPVAASPSPKPIVRVYGLELEGRGDTERLLVFAEGVLEPRLEEPDPDTVVLVLPGARLDPSAPGRLQPQIGQAVTGVSVFEPTGGAPEVRVVIRRARGIAPILTQRGATLSVAFTRPETGGLTLDFRNAELAEVVRQIAAATGESFLFDDTLRGRVTIAVGEEVSPEAALEILHAALLVKGFAAVPTPGGTRRILPVSQAQGTAMPVRGEARETSDAMVTTLLTLESADPQQVVAALQPAPGGGRLALPYPATRAVILAGSEASVARWIGLARALDAAAAEPLEVVPLDYASASDMAQMLEEIAARSPERRPETLRIWPDDRTNTVILAGAPDRIDAALGWIERLDVRSETRGRMEVIRLRHADAERLVELPRTLAAADGAGGNTLAGREFQIVADPPTQSLVVAGDPETRSLVYDLIRAVDRPPPQIRLEMTVLEIRLDAGQSLGIDFLIPFTDFDTPGDTLGFVSSNPDGVDFVNDPTRSFVGRVRRSPVVIPILDDMGVPIPGLEIVIPRETFVLTAEDGRAFGKVLSRPQLLMTSGEEQRLFAGDNVPIPRASGATSNALSVSQTFDRQDVGVDLKVTPTAGEEGGVRLDLALELSAVGESETGPVEEVGATLLKRSLEVGVTLADGQIAVLAGAERPVFEERVTGSPFLTRLPILGSFFRRVDETERSSLLVITVQAWIDRDADSRVASSIRRRLGFERQLARLEGLGTDPRDGYAVLVTTSVSKSEAEAAARELGGAGAGEPRVSRWSWEGVERFDVHLTGFAHLAEAAAASNRIRRLGWPSRLVVIPSNAPAARQAGS